jgi:2-oxoglutarate ferredoxin oxidoreductase subunit alpha
MQLTGDRFTQETAIFGNDLSTLPNFPAEIRAPAGHAARRLSFQLHFADHDILTPGDAPDVLVAMNPAALKANLKDLPRGADAHRQHRRVHRAQPGQGRLPKNPLEDGSLDGYRVHRGAADLADRQGARGPSLSRKDAERAKNMFALGLLSWLYNRPVEGTLSFLEAKFAKKPEIAEANGPAFQAGWNFGETTEEFAVPTRSSPGPARSRHLPQHHRQPGAGLRPDRGARSAAAAAVPRLLPDHPGLGHPARARQAQALRRAHLPGRGRDRGVGAALGAAFGGRSA